MCRFHGYMLRPFCGLILLRRNICSYRDFLCMDIMSKQGHIVTHASNILHGGHPITSGVRYILVAFVILDEYQNYAMRFANHVWEL